MPSTTTPDAIASAQSRIDTINHIRWQARAVTGLLSAVNLLPAADQQTTLETTARLADELARDLAALAQAISHLSQLAVRPELGIVEAEVNPMLVMPEGQGVTAVDALMLRCKTE